MALIGTADAAAYLGVSVRWVQVLIKARRLPAQKVGGVWIIEEMRLDELGERKRGRPAKKGAR